MKDEVEENGKYLVNLLVFLQTFERKFFSIKFVKSTYFNEHQIYTNNTFY